MTAVSPRDFLKDDKNRLIFALDVPSGGEAIKLVRELKSEVRLFKVGTELFMAGGLEVVAAIANEGRAQSIKIFLDLKFLDIPETMKRSFRQVRQRSSDILFATIHWFTGGGGEAAPDFAEIGVPLLLVTLLTSMGQEDLTDLGITRSTEDYVLFQAEKARLMKCCGVVASAREAPMIKQKFGEELLVVTPGIRPAGTSEDDHKRTATPGEAIRNGADFLVVGRPIRNSPDGPFNAARRIQAEISEALAERHG